MSRKKSEEFFHVLPENLNCAQAVLKGFQKEFDITDQEIEEFRAWGGGRAKDGVCGALFSAEKLLFQAGKPGIVEEFAKYVGNVLCQPIKQSKFPCVNCVKMTDNLIEKRLE